MVLPVHDLNPLRRTPYVTYLLVAVNVAVFLLAEPVFGTLRGSASDCRQQLFFYEHGAIPHELISGHALQVVSACGTVTTANPALSVLEAMFLHGSWIHLAGNMLFLVVFGNNVEDRMGRALYLLFYLGCGYAAAYGFAVVQSDSTAPLVGASGAIAGVLGAYLVVFPRARVVSLLTFFFFLPVLLPAWLVLGGWFLLQWLYANGTTLAAGSGVAYAAHVIGFAVGVLVTRPFVGRLRTASGQPPPWRTDARAYRRLHDAGWWE